MLPVNLTTNSLNISSNVDTSNTDKVFDLYDISGVLKNSSDHYNSYLFEFLNNKDSIFYTNIPKIQYLNSLFQEEYFPILLFLFISIALSLIILVFSYLLAVQNPDTEKLSAYECGFDPYEDARHTFDVRFYLVAILFIIFDIETMFLFP